MQILIKKKLKKLAIEVCMIALFVPRLSVNAIEQNVAQSVRIQYETYIIIMNKTPHGQVV